MSVEGLKDSEVLIVPKSGSKTTLEGIFLFFSCCGEVFIGEIIISISVFFACLFFWDTYSYPTFPNESN